MDMDFNKTVATYESFCITHYSRGYDWLDYTPSQYLADLKREYDRWIHIATNTWTQSKDACMDLAERSLIKYSIFYGGELWAPAPDNAQPEWIEGQKQAQATGGM